MNTIEKKPRYIISLNGGYYSGPPAVYRDQSGSFRIVPDKKDASGLSKHTCENILSAIKDQLPEFAPFDIIEDTQ